MWAFFTLPTDWLTTIKGTISELFSDFSPLLMVMIGIMIAMGLISALIGLIKH